MFRRKTSCKHALIGDGQIILLAGKTADFQITQLIKLNVM